MVPLHRQAYISVLGASSVTVSGPPSTLKLLFKTSSGLLHARRTPIHLTAAYHANHLDVCDVDKIIGTSPMLDRDLTPNTSITSTSSRQITFESRKLREVLYGALVEVLQSPVDWPMIIQNLTLFSKGMETTLFVIGPTSAAGSVERALRPNLIYNLAETTASDEDLSPFKHRPTSESIAIVGMSGRFPNGENLDDFWLVLENGLDLHKEV